MRSSEKQLHASLHTFKDFNFLDLAILEIFCLFAPLPQQPNYK